MKIKIICVGKIKEQYLADGIDDYIRKIQKAVPVEIVELPDEKTPQGASEVLENRIKEMEGKRILEKISSQGSFIIINMVSQSELLEGQHLFWYLLVIAFVILLSYLLCLV